MYCQRKESLLKEKELKTLGVVVEGHFFHVFFIEFLSAAIVCVPSSRNLKKYAQVIVDITVPGNLRVV